MSGLTPEQAAAEIMRTVPVLQEEAVRAMRQAVELTWQRMSEYAPHGATGELARDITHSVTQTRDGVSGRVRPRSRHARFVDQGTGQGKTIRNRAGSAYSAETGLALSAEQETADPFGVMTAAGWGSKTPGKPLVLHLPGGRTIFRANVRGQRARHFVQHTRDATLDEVENVLTAGAQHATDRLFA